MKIKHSVMYIVYLNINSLSMSPAMANVDRLTVAKKNYYKYLIRCFLFRDRV